MKLYTVVIVQVLKKLGYINDKIARQDGFALSYVVDKGRYIGGNRLKISRAGGRLFQIASGY